MSTGTIGWKFFTAFGGTTELKVKYTFMVKALDFDILKFQVKITAPLSQSKKIMLQYKNTRYLNKPHPPLLVKLKRVII